MYLENNNNKFYVICNSSGLVGNINALLWILRANRQGKK